uniref:Fungal lipase-like domain-containing protein n=1 Tax=Panagrolaimus davidi TaxID=227884 RepID=A0A914QA11_9BILA
MGCTADDVDDFLRYYALPVAAAAYSDAPSTNKFLQLVDEGWDYDDFEPLIGGNVAEYFYNGFTDIWNHGMKNDFYQLKNKYPSYNILIVGHSLGGAMASIAAATIVSTGVVPASKVYLYTFGQPRTGNTDYAAAFNALGNSTELGL